jgi:hypothetical protein
MNDAEAIEQAKRLEEMGLQVVSAEIQEAIDKLVHFQEHGNRDLRRSHKRAGRKKGNTKKKRK